MDQEPTPSPHSTSALLLDEFLNYLDVERGLSPHTRASYRFDLSRFIAFAEGRGRGGFEAVRRDDVVGLLADMAAAGRIVWERRAVARGDFERCAFALLALPPEETKAAAVLAAGTGCLLDCCADAGACDWSLAAQFRAGGFTVGVASGGASPSGSAALKERLRAVLEDESPDGTRS